MASKSKVAQRKQATSAKKINLYLIAIPVIAFIIKLIIMSNIKNANGGLVGGWLGADGENYLSGTDGLLQQGYFSDKSILSYWPAGYPILIWFLTKISLAHVLYLISFTQSIFYAYASYYFVKQLRNTRLQPYMFVIGLVLAFNPTLSLSSLAVGYESPVAACMLMVVGLILKSRQNGNDRGLVLRVISAGFFSALATFMQPRWVLTSIVIAIIWALMYKNRKVQALILVGVVGIMAIAPAILIQRNQQSIHKAIISTNISAALKIGTGPDTSGGYNHKGPDINCKSVSTDPDPTDTQYIACAAKWYLTHPVKTLQLSWNKSLYFWSPWSGPTANGTMARNPWLKINPLINIAKSSQQGNKLIYGAFGKIISWIWLFAGIFLLFYGFIALKREGEIERHLAKLMLFIVLSSWLAAIATIGDHRFRIPTMSISLVLQVFGLWKIKEKILKN